MDMKVITTFVSCPWNVKRLMDITDKAGDIYKKKKEEERKKQRNNK